MKKQAKCKKTGMKVGTKKSSTKVGVKVTKTKNA